MATIQDAIDEVQTTKIEVAGVLASTFGVQLTDDDSEEGLMTSSEEIKPLSEWIEIIKNTTVNADTVDNYHASNTYTANYIPVDKEGILNIGKQLSFNYDSNNVITLEASSDGITNSGRYFANSDIRYKSIISYLSIPIEDLASLPIFTYKWNDRKDQTTYVGTSAQEVETMIPELVSENTEGFKSLDYSSLGAIAAIQCAKKIKELEYTIEELQNRIKLLEANG